MPKNIGLSISGKNNTTMLSLKGSLNNSNENIPYEVRNLKISIMNLVIIPYMAHDWRKLEENIWFIEKLINKIDYYSSIYNNETLLMYKEVLMAYHTIIIQHIEIFNLEKKIVYNDVNNVSSIVFKTSIIRLKAEYEIYNLIFGKPQSGLHYNKIIIADILKLIQIDDITFDKIKNYILNKYPII